MQCAGLGDASAAPRREPHIQPCCSRRGAPTRDHGGVRCGREMRSSFVCVCTGIFPAPSYCRCVGGSLAQALLCTQCSGSVQGHGTWDRDNAGCGWHKGHLVQTGPAALADDNGEALGLVGVPGWVTCTPSHHGTKLAEYRADEGSAFPVSPLPWSSPGHGAMGAGEGSLLQKREPAPAPLDLTSLQSEHPAPALALSRGRCWGQGTHHGEAPARTLGLPPGGAPPAQGGGDRDAGRRCGSPCPPQALSPAPQSISRDHAAFQPLGTSKHLPPALGLINLLPPGPSPSTRHFLPATRPAPGQAPLAPGPVPAPARGAAPCPRHPQPPSAWGCCWSWGGWRLAVLWQRRHRPSVPSICWAKSKTVEEAQPGRAPGGKLQCCRSVCSVPLPCADVWTQTSGTGLAWEHGDSKVIGHGRASSSCLCTHKDSCRAMLCGTACAWHGPGRDMCEWGARCAGTVAWGPAQGVFVCTQQGWVQLR